MEAVWGSGSALLPSASRHGAISNSTAVDDTLSTRAAIGGSQKGLQGR
uniref:Uncharacterized protein n=1 Tax=Tetraselmis sp. GSL018 TaxID=582737 RepID=A0A061S4K9_9CHLO